MRINYEKFKELNIETLTADGNSQLACFYIIQSSIERYLSGETLTEECKNFLIDVGVLVQEVQEERKEIVKPFNFMGDGPQSN